MSKLGKQASFQGKKKKKVSDLIFRNSQIYNLGYQQQNISLYSKFESTDLKHQDTK